MHLVNLAERIDEAHRLVRRYLETPYEAAAMAYLAAQVEQAQKCRVRR